MHSTPPAYRIYTLIAGGVALFLKWICIALMLALMPVCAHASPEPEAFHCMLVPTLESTGTLEPPFDRWARELIALIQPEIHWTAWPEGQAMLMDVWIGDLFCFSFELLTQGDKVAIQSSLTDYEWRILAPPLSHDALALLDLIRDILAPDLDWPQADSTLRMDSARGSVRLAQLADTLRRWSLNADSDVRECVNAIATILDVSADITERSPRGTPLIATFVDYQSPNLVPGEIEPDWPDAKSDIAAALVASIPREVMMTISGLAL